MTTENSQKSRSHPAGHAISTAWKHDRCRRRSRSHPRLNLRQRIDCVCIVDQQTQMSKTHLCGSSSSQTWARRSPRSARRLPNARWLSVASESHCRPLCRKTVDRCNLRTQSPIAVEPPDGEPTYNKNDCHPLRRKREPKTCMPCAPTNK